MDFRINRWTKSFSNQFDLSWIKFYFAGKFIFSQEKKIIKLNVVPAGSKSIIRCMWAPWKWIPQSTWVSCIQRSSVAPNLELVNLSYPPFRSVIFGTLQLLMFLILKFGALAAHFSVIVFTDNEYFKKKMTKKNLNALN